MLVGAAAAVVCWNYTSCRLAKIENRFPIPRATWLMAVGWMVDPEAAVVVE